MLKKRAAALAHRWNELCARWRRTALRRRRTRAIGTRHQRRLRGFRAVNCAAIEGRDERGNFVGRRLGLSEECADRAIVVRKRPARAIESGPPGHIVVIVVVTKVARVVGMFASGAVPRVVVRAGNIVARSVPEKRVQPLPEEGRAAKKGRKKPAKMALDRRSHQRNRRKSRSHICKPRRSDHP